MKRDDVFSLNLHCLMLLRDCARVDISEACYRFGCEKVFAEEICNMSMEAMGGLAKTDSLLFNLRYNIEDVRKAVRTEPQYRSLLLEGFDHAPA